MGRMGSAVSPYRSAEQIPKWPRWGSPWGRWFVKWWVMIDPYDRGRLRSKDRYRVWSWYAFAFGIAVFITTLLFFTFDGALTLNSWVAAIYMVPVVGEVIFGIVPLWYHLRPAKTWDFTSGSWK